MIVVAAFLIGRYHRQPGGEPSTGPRLPASPRHHGISGQWFARDHATPRFLDVETGAVTPWTLPGPNRVEPLGCSPWRDADGQHHLALLCRPLARSPDDPHTWDFTLARCTYPEGRVLGRVAIEGMPPVCVCWAPDRSDRLLLVASDGQLYSYEFPAVEWAGVAPARPRPIPWGCDPPGIGMVHLRDLCWQGKSVPDGRLLVSLAVQEDASRPIGETRLWWLQLAPDGAEIASASRVLAPGEGREGERMPVVGLGRDGRPMLAYLARGRGDWELWVTPIAPGASAGALPTPTSPGTRLAGGCVAVAPTFSPDGRWVYAALRDPQDGIRMGRFEVAPPGNGSPATRSAKEGPVPPTAVSGAA
jgi:hypothetical protein